VAKKIRRKFDSSFAGRTRRYELLNKGLTLSKAPLKSLGNIVGNFLEFLEASMSELNHCIYEFGPFHRDTQKPITR